MTKTFDFIFGIHAVAACIERQPRSIVRLLLWEARSDKRMAGLLAEANKRHIPIELCARPKLDQITGHARHQGVVALIEPRASHLVGDIPTLLAQQAPPYFLLILDGVEDPHNLGACLRTASAAGVHAVIAPRDKAVGLTPVVRKVAAGAAEHVPFIQVTNLARALRELKEQGIWVWGTTLAAKASLYQADLRGSIALVLGAEGTGLRRLTEAHCDHVISIPMSGDMASLNVSVAAGVVLFEAKRQRLLASPTS